MRFSLEAIRICRRHPNGTDFLLRDASFTLHPGERWAVVGPSGCGKSLLLRSLALFEPIHDGKLLWNGRRPHGRRVPTYRRQVCYLHQRPTFCEGTVEENLLMPYRFRCHTDQHYDQRWIVDQLHIFGRDESFLEQPAHRLSGGECQIAALLRALQFDPLVLLLDEATSALDQESVGMAEEIVDNWMRDHPGGRSVVWISHDPAQVERMARRKIMMERGRILEVVNG